MVKDTECWADYAESEITVYLDRPSADIHYFCWEYQTKTRKTLSIRVVLNILFALLLWRSEVVFLLH